MIRIIALGVLFAVSLNAHAQQGFYAGAGLGSSQVEAGPFDSSDTGLQIFGGYRFREGALPLDSTFGIEGGYVDFGSPDDRVFGDSLKLDLTGVALYAVVSKPFGERWSVFGKIGVLSWDAKFSADGSSVSDDGSDTAAGLGVSLQTSNAALSVRGEIEGFDYLDGVWLYSVSVVYAFGGAR